MGMGPGQPAKNCNDEELVGEFESACRGGDHEFAPEYRDELLRRLTHRFRPEVIWFAEQMEQTLRRNDHKGGWDGCHPDWLIERLFQEANELWREIPKGQHDKIIREATDVANFAMMIADKARLMKAD